MTKKEIFTTYRMDIFRTCYYMVKDYHDAEDLCQDVFIKAFQEDINKIEKVKPWLIRIAMNTSRNYLKRKSRITLKEDFLNFMNKIVGTGRSVEDEQQRKETVNELAQLLGELPEKTRMVIILKYVHELKNREIAEIVGVPLGTIKSRVYHGLEILRKKIETPNYSPLKGVFFHERRNGEPIKTTIR